MTEASNDQEPATWHRRSATESNERASRPSEALSRTAAEKAQNARSSHAAAFHWRKAGSEVHAAGAHMLLAHVNALLREGSIAMPYARRSFDFVTPRASPDREAASGSRLQPACPRARVCPSASGRDGCGQRTCSRPVETGTATGVLVLQQPNFFGLVEDVVALRRALDRVDAARRPEIVVAVEPVSLGVLLPPGEYGAAIAVGEGQSLGLPPICSR